ncbi:hypothetical protein FOA52_003298 [Chlamydomonas sp. UWO 241]|nr:hypothetical protein FOA52_003298 [Chlamydomonas sp. UWO 241]
MSTSAPCGEGCAVLASHALSAPGTTTVRMQLHEQHGSLRMMVEQSCLGHHNKVVFVLGESNEWATKFYAKTLQCLGGKCT